MPTQIKKSKEEIQRTYELKREKRRLKDGERKICNGYVYIRVNSYWVTEHRYIWEKHCGKIPEGMMIHHKNGIKEDNRIENLELFSRLEHGHKHKELNKEKREVNIIVFDNNKIYK